MSINKTHTDFWYKGLLKLKEVNSQEMFSITPEVGSMLFNTDLQIVCIYTQNGWTNMNGDLIYQTIFEETFETGNLNNWQVKNDRINKWIVGTKDKYKGTYSAYVSNDGINPRYTNNRTQNSHIYKDIALPDANEIKLTLYFKGRTERNYDRIFVAISDTNYEPIAGRIIDTSKIIGKLENVYNWTKYEFDLTEHKNSTIRLIFSWHNDSSVGGDSGRLDNIRIAKI